MSEPKMCPKCKRFFLHKLCPECSHGVVVHTIEFCGPLTPAQAKDLSAAYTLKERLTGHLPKRRPRKVATMNPFRLS